MHHNSTLKVLILKKALGRRVVGRNVSFSSYSEIARAPKWRNGAGESPQPGLPGSNQKQLRGVGTVMPSDRLLFPCVPLGSADLVFHVRPLSCGHHDPSSC